MTKEIHDAQGQSIDAPLKPFTSDGCSGGMSWIWHKFTGHGPPWEKACVEHDRAYWCGGTRRDRLKADKRLFWAVVDHGWRWTAVVMFLAIRVFGHPYWPFSCRWCYGHKWPGKYKMKPFVPYNSREKETGKRITRPSGWKP